MKDVNFTDRELFIILNIVNNNKKWAEYSLNYQLKDKDKIERKRNRIVEYQDIMNKIYDIGIKLEEKQ